MRAFLYSDGRDFFAPDFTLFYALAIIPLLGIIGELMKQIAGKTVAFPTVSFSLAFTAGLYGAAITPERFAHMYAAWAVHLLTVDRKSVV